MPKSWKQPKRIISLAELSLHRKRQSCWLAINGEVYDVTRYITKHPGANTILKGAGIDSTQLFTHSSKLGHSHSTGASELLAQYHIGSLED
jgi:cytochrome b involved in lipid metabolism